MNYIVLYADDFAYDVWEEYCRVCKVSTYSTCIKIKFEDGMVESGSYGYADDSEDEAEESYTAFAYEDDGATSVDLSTYDTKEEAIEFAKSRNWDEVINDITGEVVWRR